MHDFRLAVRALRATPIVSAVAALSLALGIGANTAVFSLVNSLLLSTLPVVEPQRLVTVSSGAAVTQLWSYAIWDQIRQRAHTFDGAVSWFMEPFDMAQGGEMQPSWKWLREADRGRARCGLEGSCEPRDSAVVALMRFFTGSRRREHLGVQPPEEVHGITPGQRDQWIGVGRNRFTHRGHSRIRRWTEVLWAQITAAAGRPDHPRSDGDSRTAEDA